MSESLPPHGLQHARLPCPSLSPGVCSHSCPLSRWCHLTTSSSAALFSTSLQSFPASGSFPVSYRFMSGSQSTGFQLQHQSFQWIFGFDFLQDWLVGSCCLKDSQESSPEPHFERTIPWHFVFFMVQLSHPYLDTGNTMALTIWTFVGKVMSLVLNMLPSFVITFLPWIKCILISWVQSP